MILDKKKKIVIKNDSKAYQKNKEARESYTIAAQQCKFFFGTIIKLNERLEKKIKSKKIKFFEESEVNIQDNNIGITFKKEDNFKEIESILPELKELNGALESFSMFFTDDIANEKLAYSSLGEIYMQIVEKNLPFIYPCYEYTRNSKYASIIELYLRWNKNQRIDGLLNY